MNSTHLTNGHTPITNGIHKTMLGRLPAQEQSDAATAAEQQAPPVGGLRSDAPGKDSRRGPPEALDFASSARKRAHRLASEVQEAIACGYEIERMPRVAKRVRRLLNDLERVDSLLRTAPRTAEGASDPSRAGTARNELHATAGTREPEKLGVSKHESETCPSDLADLAESALNNLECGMLRVQRALAFAEADGGLPDTSRRLRGIGNAQRRTFSDLDALRGELSRLQVTRLNGAQDHR